MNHLNLNQNNLNPPNHHPHSIRHIIAIIAIIIVIIAMAILLLINLLLLPLVLPAFKPTTILIPASSPSTDVPPSLLPLIWLSSTHPPPCVCSPQSPTSPSSSDVSLSPNLISMSVIPFIYSSGSLSNCQM